MSAFLDTEQSGSRALFRDYRGEVGSVTRIQMDKNEMVLSNVKGPRGWDTLEMELAPFSVFSW